MTLSGALEIASCTDPGMVRSHNEDSIASDADKGLVVLADGMGGYNAGEVASGMATTVIITELQQLLEKTGPHGIDERSGEEIAHQLLRVVGVQGDVRLRVVLDQIDLAPEQSARLIDLVDREPGGQHHRFAVDIEVAGVVEYGPELDVVVCRECRCWQAARDRGSAYRL